jgi:polysaccharide biosynthesis transport protein
MAEELEQQNPEGLDLQHWLGVARRRHFHFLIPLFVAWAAVWGASWVLPPKYVSSTLILVEQPTMPKDYVTPNVNEDLQERLQSIIQQIESRTRLLHIIDQFGLYNIEHAQRSPDQKVELMRKDIGIELEHDPHNQITSFNVSYSSGDPRTAQQVTSELTNLFINENLEVRQQESEGTTQFLESQMESARKTLAEQEDRVRQFKAQHPGELPGQTASNIQILAGLQSQLQNDEDALNAAKQQHVYLQSLADQYRTMHETSKSADGTVVGLPALDQQINKLEAQLADLSAHYTDRHPDVRKTKAELAEAEKTRDELLAKIKSQPAQPDAENAQASAAAASLDPTQASVVPQVQSQLRSNQLEITNREHSITALKTKIEDYQARLNEEPIREQQLADLTRGYEQSKSIYDELLKKKNDSAMATSMELLQQGERFRIMDAPSFPTKPSFPNRLKFCGMGLGIGLALGVVIAGAFEMVDHRVYDEKQLKTLLPIAILAEIPEVISREDEQRQRRLLWLGWATGVFVVCCILAGTAFSYLRG